MDEIIATVEVLDGINIEVEDSTSEISASLEEVNEINLEAFDYPPEVEAIHERLDDLEEALPAISQNATQALEDAATADGKAVAAQETANDNSDRLDNLTNGSITRDGNGNITSITTFEEGTIINRDIDGNITGWENDNYTWSLTRDGEGNITGWTYAEKQ